MHQNLRTEEFCAVELKSLAELEVTPVSWLWFLWSRIFVELAIRHCSNGYCGFPRGGRA